MKVDQQTQQQLLQQASVALGAIVTIVAIFVKVVGPVAEKAVAVWAAREGIKMAKRMPTNVQQWIQQAATIGAQAAEQAHLAQRISDALDEKEKYAVNVADKWLQAQGLQVDAGVLLGAVEAVVFAGLHLPPPDTSGAAPAKKGVG